MKNRVEIPQSRRDRLADLLEKQGLAAVWFARPNGFTWLTGGNNVVDRAGDVGVAAAGYDGEQVRVVTSTIEAARLEAEELPDDVPVYAYDWHEGSLAAAIKERSPQPAAADFAVSGFDTIDTTGLRQPLTERDVEQYRQLGRETASAVEDVCRAVGETDTERNVAARLRGRLAEAGIDSPVALVGGARRAQTYRHYTPTEEPLGAYALVSVTAERGGLFASCTRTIAFDAPSWLEERHAGATRVEATALAATRSVGREGGDAGAIFDAVQTAYETVGWEDEWRQHHQGGAAGFAGREWIGTPDSSATVWLPMAYAWNPTIQGAKSEGTVLVTSDGYETLTAGDWPTRSVDAVGYDATFERPAVLHR